MSDDGKDSSAATAPAAPAEEQVVVEVQQQQQVPAWKNPRVMVLVGLLVVGGIVAFLFLVVFKEDEAKDAKEAKKDDDGKEIKKTSSTVTRTVTSVNQCYTTQMRGGEEVEVPIHCANNVNAAINPTYTYKTTTDSAGNATKEKVPCDTSALPPCCLEPNPQAIVIKRAKLMDYEDAAGNTISSPLTQMPDAELLKLMCEADYDNKDDPVYVGKNNDLDLALFEYFDPNGCNNLEDEEARARCRWKASNRNVDCFEPTRVASCVNTYWDVFRDTLKLPNEEALMPAGADVEFVRANMCTLASPPPSEKIQDYGWKVEEFRKECAKDPTIVIQRRKATRPTAGAARTPAHTPAHTLPHHHAHDLALYY
jgi:hypothetical protein